MSDVLSLCAGERAAGVSCGEDGDDREARVRRVHESGVDGADPRPVSGQLPRTSAFGIRSIDAATASTAAAAKATAAPGAATVRLANFCSLCRSLHSVDAVDAVLRERQQQHDLCADHRFEHKQQL